MYPGDAEEFPQQFEGRQILQPEQVVERVDEILPLIAEDMIEDLLVVIANDLNLSRSTHPEDPKPLSFR